MGDADWTTIESDPGVFTELVEQIGVKGLAFEELYSLDQLDSFPDVYGLIFLFKWKKEADVDKQPGNIPESLFLAKQVITNACATQAILSIILNMEGFEGFKLGPELSEFKAMVAEFDPEMKGLAIGNRDVIRNAHNSFHRVSSFEFVKEDSKEKEDAFHFISYVPHTGAVFELDGLKPTPYNLGAISDSWLKVAKPEIEKRIQKYQEGETEIRFNLLAVTRNKKDELEQKQLKPRHLYQRLQIKLVSLGENLELHDELDDEKCPAGVTAFEELPDDLEELKKMAKEAKAEIDALGAEIAVEKTKQDSWRRENARRKHDFTPLVLCALKKLAEKGQLMKLFEAGKVAADAAAAKEAEKKEAAKA